MDFSGGFTVRETLLGLPMPTNSCLCLKNLKWPRHAGYFRGKPTPIPWRRWFLLLQAFFCIASKPVDIQDISEAIRHQQRADQFKFPDDHHAEASAHLLNNFGTPFFLRFKRTGEMQDIVRGNSTSSICSPIDKCECNSLTLKTPIWTYWGRARYIWSNPISTTWTLELEGHPDLQAQLGNLHFWGSGSKSTRSKSGRNGAGEWPSKIWI